MKKEKKFATRAKQLVINNADDIKFVSITVKKQRVQAHIRTDANKLYNYMISLSLVEHMKHFDQVTFIPDPRSVKVESGNSLHDYIQTALWFEHSVQTMLETKPIDSSACVNLQFAVYVIRSGAGLLRRFKIRALGYTICTYQSENVILLIGSSVAVSPLQPLILIRCHYILPDKLIQFAQGINQRQQFVFMEYPIHFVEVMAGHNAFAFYAHQLQRDAV